MYCALKAAHYKTVSPNLAEKKGDSPLHRVPTRPWIDSRGGGRRPWPVGARVLRRRKMIRKQGGAARVCGFCTWYGHCGTSFASARVRARYLFAWVDKRARAKCGCRAGGRTGGMLFFFLSLCSLLSFCAPPAALLLLGTAPVDFSLTSQASNCRGPMHVVLRPQRRTNPCAAALTSSLTTLHIILWSREWCLCCARWEVCCLSLLALAPRALYCVANFGIHPSHYIVALTFDLLMGF